jgi:hypothetical protein
MMRTTLQPGTPVTRAASLQSVLDVLAYTQHIVAQRTASGEESLRRTTPQVERSFGRQAAVYAGSSGNSAAGSDVGGV